MMSFVQGNKRANTSIMYLSASLNTHHFPELSHGIIPTNVTFFSFGN